MARSCLPSPLKSPTVTELGLDPVTNSRLIAKSSARAGTTVRNIAVIKNNRDRYVLTLVAKVRTLDVTASGLRACNRAAKWAKWIRILSSSLCFITSERMSAWCRKLCYLHRHIDNINPWSFPIEFLFVVCFINRFPTLILWSLLFKQNLFHICNHLNYGWI